MNLDFLKKMDKMKCCVLCVVIGFILGCFYVQSKNSGMEGLENQGKNMFVYCHMNGCPHCEKVTPKWDDFVNDKETKEKYERITFIKLENSEHPEFMEKYGIKGFPSFVFIDSSGKKTDVNGRSKKAWSSFLDSMK